LTVTVGIGVLRGTAAATQEIIPAPTVTRTAAEVFVHVAGAVRAPGLYRLVDGARVVDAVAAAGGYADDADRGVLNLARTVSDGEQIVVPVIGAVAAPPAGASAPAGGGDGRVNLNTADATALDTLPRIGPAMAQRILDWRDDNGRFTSVDDLLAVPGIGDKMLEALRELVTV
jgi:competence protein ComEA